VSIGGVTTRAAPGRVNRRVGRFERGKGNMASGKPGNSAQGLVGGRLTAVLCAAISLFAVVAPGAMAAENAEEDYERLSEASQAKEYVKALELGEAFVVEHPDHPEIASALHLAAMGGRKSSNFKRAVPLFRKILEDHPQFESTDEVRFGLATCLAGMRALEECIKQCRENLEAAPESPNADYWRFLIPQSQFRLWRFKEAKEGFEAFLASHPDSTYAAHARQYMERINPSWKVDEDGIAAYSGKYNEDHRFKAAFSALPGYIKEGREKIRERLGVDIDFGNEVNFIFRDAGPDNRLGFTAETFTISRNNKPVTVVQFYAEHVVIDPAGYRRTVIHEMKHAGFKVLMGQSYNDLPIWIREGLAQWAAEQLEPRMASKLNNETFAGNDPFAEMNGVAHPVHSVADYLEDVLAFEWLEKHKKGSVIAFSKGLVNGEPWQELLAAATGLDTKETLRQMDRYCRDRVADELGAAGRDAVTLRDTFYARGARDAAALQEWLREEGNRRFAEWLDKHPRHALEPVVRFYRGRGLILTGDLEQGRKWLRGIIETEDGNTLRDDALFWEGYAFQQEGRMADAERSFCVLLRDYSWSNSAPKVRGKFDPAGPEREPDSQPAHSSQPDLPSEPEHIIAEGGSVPVKIVGGRLVAHVELSTIHNRVPANLFIEFDNPCGLRLHNRVAAALQAENEAGETTPISIHFPEFAHTVESREMGPEREYEEFTRLYSREIDEDALVGAIGAKILSRYRVTFDLHEGVLELEVPSERQEKTDEEDEAAVREDELEVAITTTDDIVWLPVQLTDGKVHAMAVSTTYYDSLVDNEWCDRLGFPAGDVGTLNLGDLDISQFVAFRPAEVIYVHPDRAIGVLGLNLLKHLRLTIDRKGKTAVCRVTALPEYPEADRGFFKAMVEEDADQLEAWLEKYPQERLSQEAAQMLVGYRIDEDAEPEQFERAVHWLRGTWREDLVSTRALDLMRDLRAAGYPMRAVFAGELGIEGGRKDRYPNTVHQLHASMGEILLDHDEDRRAWRHLLSAAFGLPGDGLINLKLGQFYEKQERYHRALSRYVQAVVTVDAGEKALEGLERVQRKMGDAQPISVDTIGPLIAGKTYNYAAATRYRPRPGEETNRVSLVEFFTNTHFKQPGKEEGAIGGALGNEGVMTYFPREKVAMLAYHLPHPQLELDSLVNGLAQATADFYRVAPVVQLVNGTRRFPGVGHVSEAEQVFRAGRDVILASLRETTDFELELSSFIEGDEIAGTLNVTNRSSWDANRESATVQIVLAERGVLYPGKSKIVIQRMVARAALTDSLQGMPFEPQDGRMAIPFSRSLAAVAKANVDYLKRIEAAGAGTIQTFAAKMDPRQLTVVAYVRDGSSKKILQAIQVNPRQPQATGIDTSE